MPLSVFPFPHTLRPVTRRLMSVRAAVAVLMLAGCGDSSGPDGDDGTPPGGGVGTLSGTVRSAAPPAVLEGATVRIGDRLTTSDGDGRYSFADIPVGTVTVRAERTGYLPAEATIAINTGANTRDFTLNIQEIFHSGQNSVYVPGGVGPLRGVIVALGGPVTRGFVTGEQIAPANSVELEASLQQLGAALRVLAKSARVALLGSAIIGMESTAANDGVLFAALQDVAGASMHPELANAPLLMFGLSAGAREAAGLVSRNPQRSIGLLVRVPVTVTALTDAAALAVPTFVMQAELDAVVDNAAVQALFADNRAQGGLWSLAVEPGAAHNVATDLGNNVVIEWISTVLTKRLPDAAGSPLIALDQTAGWLGNQTTLDIAPWADYTGDRTTASWLMTEAIANSWQRLGSEGDRTDSMHGRSAGTPSQRLRAPRVRGRG